MNIDYLKESYCNKLFTDLLTSYCLTVNNTDPTRIFINQNSVITSSKIDYILTNIDKSLYDVKVEDLNLSDHFALMININLNHQNTVELKREMIIRNESESNLLHLKTYLQNESFSSVYTYNNNINLIYSNFINILKYAIQVKCPSLKIIKSDNTNNTNKKWVTPEIIIMKTELKNMFWLLKHTGDQQLKNQYNKKKKEYKSLITNTKKAHFQRKLSKNETKKQKQIWNLVNEKRGKRKQNLPIKLYIDGLHITREDEVASEFAKYFANVAKNAVSSCTTRFVPNHISTKKDLHYSQINSFVFYPVEPQEVVDAIKNLKNTNSVGEDCISTKILKNMCEVIAEPLAYIINTSVKMGQFPDALKIGKVIPILKTNNTEAIDNYRPITILTIISKIIEKIMYNRLMKYLNKYNLLSDNQHGFRTGRSTESAAYKFVNYIYSNLDKRQFVGAVFFDLSKAFDCLDLSLTKEKLEQFGLRGNVQDWLMSYLHSRKIYVSINNNNSNYYDIDQGVPQGSVLGPLIFLLYINDLALEISSDCVILFADDTSIAVSGSTHEELQDNLDIISSQFTNWCSKNKLLVNANKTVCMQFYNKKMTAPISVTVNGTLTQCVDSTKFLGVHIDSNIRWQTHINIVSKKINSGYYAILQLKSSLENKQLINIYYALIYSAIQYNIALWGNSTGAERVLILQKRVIRLIFNLDQRESCRPYFKNNNILTVSCVYILKSISWVKTNLQSYQQSGNFHKYLTRNGNDLRTEAHSTELYKNSPAHSGIVLYNKLPNDIKNIGSVGKFKNKLKLFLNSKAYYSVKEYMEDNC